MEDYYNILSISSKSGNFIISKSYKNRMAGLIKDSASTFDIEDFIKVNQAFFVLSNEQGRKYYDLLHKCVIENMQFLKESTILMYTEIIDNLAEKGKEKAQLLIGNLGELNESDFVKPLLILFLLQGFFKSPRLILVFSGFGGLIFSLLSFSFFYQSHKAF